MAFFLLARGADDDVSLLTPSLFANRHDALAELSRLTAEPEFDHWDDEILVVDADAAAPVLLMRPSAAAPTPEIIIAEPIAEDLSAVEPTPAVSFGEPLAAEQPAVSESDADSEPEEDSDGTAVVVIADDAIMDEIVDSLAQDEESGADAEELAPEDGAPSGDLKDALLRTASVMEASGIVAPESIGPAEPASEPGIADDLLLDEFIAGITPDDDVAAVQEVAPDAVESEPEAEVAETALIEEVMVPASELEMEAASKPEPETETEIEAEPEPDIEMVAAPEAEAGTESDTGGDGTTAAWPWDVAPVAPEPSEAVPEPGDAAEIAVPAVENDFVLSDLEAPGPDSSDMLRGSIDAETLAANRPVILGAYGESETADPTAADTDADEALAADDDAGSASEVVVADPSPLDAYTCGDCVYEATCPNKDQRLPRDCGTFQWK